MRNLNINQIATSTGVHHQTVNRVVASSVNADKKRVPTRRKIPRKVDPYIPFLQEKIKEYPQLTSQSLFTMAKARGYPGGRSQLAAVVQELRPKKQKEAFLMRYTLPGEEAQVDWGHFGTIEISGTVRPLSAFVMVLSWSRALYVEFFPSMSLSCFLQGHIHAFTWFGGVPKECLYDNLKSVVIERVGQHIRFNQQFLQFAGQCRFKPQPVGVRKGNEKGRVERAIRYLRSGFIPGRSWRNLEDLNQQVHYWCRNDAIERKIREHQDKTVRALHQEEQLLLTPLPSTALVCGEFIGVKAGKTPFIRFDTNDYSIPHKYVQESLIVSATADLVRISTPLQEIARHNRCWGKKMIIQDPSHLAALMDYKRQARTPATMSQLITMLPSGDAFLKELAARNIPIQHPAAQLLEFITVYGATAVEEAVAVTLRTANPSLREIQQHLSILRSSTEHLVTLDDPERIHVHVPAADISVYDQLFYSTEDKDT